MTYNDQIWRVAISFVNSTNVVKLPNPRNSIHNALRSASLSPERREWLKAENQQNGRIHGRVALKYQIALLAIRYIACYLAFIFVRSWPFVKSCRAKIRYAMRNGIPKIVNMRGGKSQVSPDIPNVTVRHDLLSKFTDK